MDPVDELETEVARMVADGSDYDSARAVFVELDPTVELDPAVLDAENDDDDQWDHADVRIPGNEDLE